MRLKISQRSIFNRSIVVVDNLGMREDVRKARCKDHMTHEGEVLAQKV